MFSILQLHVERERERERERDRQTDRQTETETNPNQRGTSLFQFHVNVMSFIQTLTFTPAKSIKIANAVL